tara:strand:+ start:731 stop:1267 length:537 start_codon:yes stop_codon:yes gene_type:complete
MNNNLELIYKRLLWLEVGILIFFVLVAVLQPTFGLDETLVDWQIYLAEQEQYFLGYILGLIILIIYIISVPLLFNYKKFGRTLFFWSHILGIPTYLLIGPMIADPVTGAVDYIGVLNGGALIVIMYLTDLKNKFTQSNQAADNRIDITSEIERISKLRENGSITEEEFKAAKDKLLNQ